MGAAEIRNQKIFDEKFSKILAQRSKQMVDLENRHTLQETKTNVKIKFRSWIL